MTRRRIGLALGGGGARGLAHIGVLKALGLAGIPIDLICGTSMGAIIAAGYAIGFSALELEARALEISHPRRMMRLVDLTPPRRGLLEGNRVKSYLTRLLGSHHQIESLPMPLGLNAVDLITAREVILTSGPLLPAVLASMAVPGLFAPVELGGCCLVDGGVLNNVPVNIARQLGADIVIAVDVSFNPQTSAPCQDVRAVRPQLPVPMPEFFMEFYHSMLVMTAEMTRIRLQENPPDFLIQPAVPRDVDMFLGFPHASEIIAAGEQAARDALPLIQKQLLGE